MIKILSGFALLAIAAAPAAAQGTNAILSCVSLIDDAARLKCYDSAAKSLSSDARQAAERREKEAAAAAAAALAASQAAEAEARRDSFGKAKSDESEVQQVDATVSEVLKDSTGKSIFVLDNGQMWRQADGYGISNVRAGSAVTVKRGSLGSFRLMPKGSNRAVAVIRMR